LRTWLAGLVAALALGGAAEAQPDLGRMSAAELTAFTQAYPKGGELHNHIGGSVFPEQALAWAVEDGFCVDVVALAIRAACTGDNLRPAAAVAADEALRSALFDSLTVRKPGFAGRSGHDQFFTAFGRMAFRPGRSGDMLAIWMDDLARQNTFYVEMMVTPQGGQSRALGARTGWKGDVAATRDAIAPGIAALVAAARAETDAMEARARQLLQCGTPAARPGCDVTVRYLVQALRIGPPEQTLAQLQLGVALIAADRRWVGLQLVAPEDSADALRHYGLHMQMVGVLTDRGRLAPAALHAGEPSLDLVTPKDLSHHVADAVRIAGARRIGHGTDLPHETGAEALLAEMAAKGVLVEINLSSSAAILQIDPKDHPVHWMRQRGVPVSLSTDDAGILRIDLAHEYATYARAGAAYEDLKRSARNALAFSFLAGEGLWADPNVYRRPAAACAGQIGAPEPRGACADLVRASDKAREQWRHERLLKAFEDARR
jgi:adenosine deaminase